MKNFVQEGDVVTLIAPVGGVTAGLGYLIGGIFVIAATTQLAGESFAGYTEGVFDLVAETHATTQAIAAGGPVYWDAANNRATKTATGNTFIGAAVEAKASTAAVVRATLGRMPNTPAAAITASVTTAATQASPWGFGTQAQADGIVTKLNAVIAALGTAGIVVPN